MEATISDTNRVALGLASEVTFNVIPTAPAFEAERFTGGSLAYTPQTVTSKEIRPDRQVTDLILVGQNAAGDLNFELSFGAQDTLVEAALCGTWTNKPSILNVTADSNITDAGTVANTYAVASALGSAFKVGMVVQASGFTNAANNQIFRVTSSTATTVVGTALSLTAETAPPAGARLRVVGFQGASADLVATITSGNALTSTALDFTTLGLVVGGWVKIGGTAAGDKLATAADNDWCRISAITATRLSFDIVPTGWAADAGTGKTLKVWAGDYVRNGTTERSFTIERQYQDLSPVVYEYLSGMEVDELTLNLDAQAIATGTAKFMGAGATLVTTRAASATDVAAPTNAVLNTSSNVGRIAENGTTITGPNYVLKGTITFKNNLRMQNAVGSVSAVGIGLGEFDVTGTLDTYFGDSTLAAKVSANTATSFDIRLVRPDANNQTILVDLPRMKYASGAPQVPGQNADVTVSLGFQAYMHPTLGYSAQISRFAYVE